jgi:hypothetical protein
MTLARVLYSATARPTGRRKEIVMTHPLSRLVFVTVLAAQASPGTDWAQVQAVLQYPGSLERSRHRSPANVFATGSSRLYNSSTPDRSRI